MRPEPVLLVDIGNTRIKWAMLIDGDLSPQQALAHRGEDAAGVVARMIVACEKPARILVSNVAGAELGERFAAAACASWGTQPEFARSAAQACGVRNAYPDPSKLGVDRWLAMLGAYALERSSACVVSVGTALTVDALAHDGRHLGGLIAPGPDLMIASLLEKTSDIAQRASGEQGHDTFFTANTRAAVESGSVHAASALIDRAYEECSHVVGGRPRLIVTGGARAHVLPHLRNEYAEYPDLVLRGLAALAAERAPTPALPRDAGEGRPS